ncbi:MAG: homoserine dehydrogenase, partial [Deltaproteobacteria bacterium]|nr:homoserine dehydrogenase [Deltaproteobacteria bacterium]
MRKSIQIGLLGLGTVGTGVARMLMENRGILEARLGVPLMLKYIADIDLERDRGLQLDGSLLTSDAFQVVNDPEVDIVVEMIGGDGIARELILKALENGKPVVTANKALLAKHGNQLFKNAMDNGVDLAYEASVGGCMP